MFADSKTKKLNGTNVIFDFIKGLIVSLIVSLGLVVLFALILKWFDLSENLIMPITFIIKYISVILGSLIAVKGESKGLLKGGLFGFIYTILAFSIFSFLAKSFEFDISVLLDLATSILLGAIVGILKVNKK